MSSDPESLDPQKFNSSEAAKVIRDIREGLLAYSADGRLVAGVASSWNVTKDGLRYTFNIRPNALWSNGTPVVAQDFVRGFHRLFDPETASPWPDELAAIENAEAIMAGKRDVSSLGVRMISSKVLQIRLSRPVSYFLQLLAHPSTFPIKYEDNEALDMKFWPTDSGLTNGPYRLFSRATGRTISLQKSPAYWGSGRVWFEKVVYHVHDPAKEVIRFRAGELDITSSVDPANFSLIKREFPEELRVSPSLNIYFYGFNLTEPPFQSNKDLRKALSLAVDRQRLVELITRRGEIPAFSFVPPEVSDYESQELSFRSLTQSERNSKARELLKKYRITDDGPEAIEIRVNSGGGHESIALAIQSMWREELGVESELVSEEFKVFIQNVKSLKRLDIFRLSWRADYDDAFSFLQLFHSDSPNNFTRFMDPEVDALLNKAKRMADESTRRSVLERAEKKILEKHPIIPIYFFVNKHLVRSDIQGWEDNAQDIHLSMHMRRIEDGRHME